MRNPCRALVVLVALLTAPGCRSMMVDEYGASTRDGPGVSGRVIQAARLVPESIHATRKWHRLRRAGAVPARRIGPLPKLWPRP